MCFAKQKEASKEGSKQASKRELLTFGSGVLLGGAPRNLRSKAHKVLHLSTQSCACHEICASRSTKSCACHEICTPRPTKSCACHQLCASTSTQYLRLPPNLRFKAHKGNGAIRPAPKLPYTVESCERLSAYHTRHF